MSTTRPGPPRTRAVAALDLVQDSVATVRRLLRMPVRMAADPRAGRVLTRGVLVAGAAVVVGTAALVVALLRGPDGFAPMGVGPGPDPEVVRPPGPGQAGIGPRSSAAGQTPAPTPPAQSTTPPAGSPSAVGPSTGVPPAPLAAEYATERISLVGYQATLTINNPGAAPVDGWTAVITLPRRTLSVAEVRGARPTQDGATWTFVPDRGTRQVPAGGRVQITFRVDGASLGSTAPTGCTVDGRPCGGEFTAAAF